MPNDKCGAGVLQPGNMWNYCICRYILQGRLCTTQLQPVSVFTNADRTVPYVLHNRVKVKSLGRTYSTVWILLLARRENSALFKRFKHKVVEQG